MSLSQDEMCRFQDLLSVVKLKEIQTAEIHSQRLRLGPVEYGKKVLNLSWKQAFAREDPLREIPKMRLFRPKYEFILSLEKENIFRHISIFAVLFEIADEKIFEEIWGMESVRTFFLEKQLMKTLWPFFRQHVMDGMNRVDLKAVALPWIV